MSNTTALDIEEVMVCDSTCKTCDGHGVVASVGFIDSSIPYPEADTCPSCGGSGSAPLEANSDECGPEPKGAACGCPAGELELPVCSHFSRAIGLITGSEFCLSCLHDHSCHTPPQPGAAQ